MDFVTLGRSPRFQVQHHLQRRVHYLIRPLPYQALRVVALVKVPNRTPPAAEGGIRGNPKAQEVHPGITIRLRHDRAT